MNERTASLYPYLDASIKIIEEHNVSINDIMNNKLILQRAVDRIRESLVSGIVSHKIEDTYVELMSFPISVIFVRLVGESYLSRRFALAEAERALVSLEKENTDYIINFALEHLRFSEIEKEQNDEEKWLKIYFVDYLASGRALFNEPKWKLVNRLMIAGKVYITKHELVRIIKEQINIKIYDMAIPKLNMVLPETMQGFFIGLKHFYDDIKPEMTQSSEINEKKYPPCIKEMLRRLRISTNLGHAERFALGTFLMNIGVERQELIDLWRVSPDWDEVKAIKQVDSLLKKNYKPPECATLKTSGLCCAGDDKLCVKANHPLSYYSMAIWKPPKKKDLNTSK